MRKEDRNVILQAAARAVAWDLFAAAEYCRRYSRISLDEFDRTLRSAVRQWSAINRNLKDRKELQP